MSQNGRIRPLDVRHDLGQVGDLVEASFAGELARRGGDLREEIRNAQRMIPLLLILSRISESFRYLFVGFVWETLGHIVAFVLQQRMGDDKRRWYISTVATHPDYRRRGLARKLVTHAMEYAREHGAEVCILDVGSDNLPAYNLYRKLGYQHYDSITSLKLETLPAVQSMLVPGYKVRSMKVGEWQARYELALRERPAEVQDFLPVSEAEYRIAAPLRLLYPLLMTLQRADVHHWGIERHGQLVGTARLSARRVPKTTHQLDLTFDPKHREAIVEPLLTLLLEKLQGYPRQNVLTSVRTAYENYLALLKRYGFEEIESMHKLGAKLK